MGHKKLYRSRDNKMIAGVCAGIAEYFDLDPTLVRLVFVLFSLGPMPGILVYLILAIVMPERPATLADEWEVPAVPMHETPVVETPVEEPTTRETPVEQASNGR